MHKKSFPFSKNVEVCSPDFDEACCFINTYIDDRIVLPLSVSGKGNNLLTRQPLGGTLLFGAQWSEKVHIQSEAQTTFHIILVLAGSIYCKTTKSEVSNGGLLVIGPNEQADLIWEKSTRAVVISLSRRALIDYFGIGFLEGPTPTTHIVSNEGKEALLLRNHIDCLAQQHLLCAGEIEPPIQNQWEQLLLTQLSQLLIPPAMKHPAILPCHVRLAVDYVMAHLKESMSVRDLLSITGSCRRSLESGFRTYLNTTPAKFILQRKLIAVRDSLQSNADLNIGDAAFSYGFHHLSHFTKQYKEAFGELPSQTIQSQRDGRIFFAKKARSRAT